MFNRVLIACILVITFGLAYARTTGIKDKDEKSPEISKEHKLELRNKILETVNLNYQIADLTRQRNQLAQSVSQDIDSLYKEYKVDKKDYQFDTDNISFIPII